MNPGDKVCIVMTLHDICGVPVEVGTVCEVREVHSNRVMLSAGDCPRIICRDIEALVKVPKFVRVGSIYTETECE